VGSTFLETSDMRPNLRVGEEIKREQREKGQRRKRQKGDVNTATVIRLGENLEIAEILSFYY
jgi:hypothetical protein